MVIGHDIDVSGRKAALKQRSDRIESLWRPLAKDPSVPATLSPLWMTGLSLAVVAMVYIGFGGPEGLLPRKLFDWALYIALGASFALATLLAYATRDAAWSETWPRWLMMLLSGIALLGLAALLLPNRWMALPLAVLQLAWTAWLYRHRGVIVAQQFLLMIVVTLLGWVAAVPLIWWDTLPERIGEQPLTIVLIALAVTMVTSWAVPPWVEVRRQSRLHQGIERGIDAVAVVLVAILAFRTDGLFLAGDPWGTMHHWGVFVGPAQEVRDGGFLLWDVPAQYGFLSTLVLAATPVDSLWQTLYYWNSLSLFLTAGAVYVVLRAVRPDWVGKTVALASGTAGVFLATTWAATLSPIHYHPSFGPFRYIWCIALLAVIAGIGLQPVGSKSEAAFLVVGSGCWLLGVFWSFESAVFCSLIWFPAYVLIVAERVSLLPPLLTSRPIKGEADWAPGSEAASTRRLRHGALPRMLGWAALPLLTLGSAVALIALVYVRALGRLPDLWGYVEYVASFGSGYVSEIARETLVLDPTDAHLAIALALVVVFASLAILLRVRTGTRVVPLLVALGTAVWLVSTYSIGRPDPHTVSRSWPFFLLSVGVALVLLGRRTDWASSVTVRAASVPLVAMLLILTYTNLEAVQWHVSALELPGQRLLQVDEGLPVADDQLAGLLTMAGLASDTPLMFDGSAGGNLMPRWTSEPDGEPVTLSRSWIPAPLTGLIVIHEDRRQMYMERMIDRRRSGGWYVHRADDKDVRDDKRWAGTGQWFFDQLAETHVPTRSYQNEAWQLIWFDYVGDAPEMRRPLIVGGQLHESPDELWIDRRSIESGQDFGIWMIPGDGWRNDGSTRKLSLSFPATASIFSDRDRTVTVKLTSGKRSRLPELDVIHNGDAVGNVRRVGETAGLFDLSLRQGWNEVVLRGQPAAASDSAPGETSYQVEIGRIDILTRGERQG